MKEQAVIAWDKAKRERLRKACKAARRLGKSDKDIFMFDEHAFILRFAEYLVEYLDMKL